MTKMHTLISFSLVAVAMASATAAGARAADTQPTCSDVLDIEVHGQHVLGDYVSNIGHDGLDWPPNGREVGEAVSSNGEAVVPGGPGPGFHFDHGIAPGASFCTDSQSPGAHL